MDTPTLLEIAAQAVSALVAVWLGLTVATRSGSPAGRSFTLLALAVATWSSCIILQRLTTSDAAAAVGRSIEDIAAALAIGGLAHFALETATDGHPTRWQLAVVASTYVILMAFALPTILHFELSIGVTPPHFSLGPIPGAVLGWGWVAVRLASVGLGLAWLLGALRTPNGGTLRRRQLGAAVATLVLAGTGASLRFLPVVGDAERWIGTSFITLAVLFAAYAVFASGIFFGPAVAARAFRTSVAGGAIVGVVVAGLAGIQVVSTTYLGFDGPFFPVLILVGGAALSGPIGARITALLRRGSALPIAQDRLLQALGQPALTARPAAAGVRPALARLRRALDVTGLKVATADGSMVVSEGKPPTSGAIPPIPLMADGELVGELLVGETTSGAPIDARGHRLLDLSAAYVASALQTGRREDEQTTELTSLAEARAQVESQAEELHAALVGRPDAAPGLHVFALGPLRAERAGSRIEHWGGDKAGSRQAQALFAFLYDRGERGVAKDEVLELIWPDIGLERADLAFHRTMGGLRSTLDSNHRRGDRAAVRFANDRYRLGDTVVAWSDVDAFRAALDGAAADRAGKIRFLEEAKRLYRGEYLDDCPYYGDSAFVEDRRALLRTRFVDLVVALAESYESGGDRLSAVAAFREALKSAPEGCPAAEAGLARLGP